MKQLALLLLIVFIHGCASSSAKVSVATRDMTLTSARLNTGADGQLGIEGTARNVSAGPVKKAVAVFELFDSEGAPVGEAMISLENIAAGQSIDFSSPVTSRACGFRLLAFKKSAASTL